MLFCLSCFRSEGFRDSFGELQELKAHFNNCPVVALSATVSRDLERFLVKKLGLKNFLSIRENPDKPNLKYLTVKKPSNRDVYACQEFVFLPLLTELQELGARFPVTLVYMGDFSWMANAQAHAGRMFGTDLKTSRYALFYSTHDKEAKDHVASELKKEDPHLRLVFCSSSIGMGFDSPSISRVIHAKPPKKMIDFVQQVGRAGRKGQQSTSVVYYNASDLRANQKVEVEDSVKQYCTSKQCLRLHVLKTFDFEEAVAELPGCMCCSNCSLSCTCSTCGGTLA